MHHMQSAYKSLLEAMKKSDAKAALNHIKEMKTHIVAYREVHFVMYICMYIAYIYVYIVVMYNIYIYIYIYTHICFNV
jgi:hypothetical protein